MIGIFFTVKSAINGVEKDTTNESSFHDVVQKVTLNGESIDFKKLNKLIPEVIEFQYGEKPVQKNNGLKTKQKKYYNI